MKFRTFLFLICLTQSSFGYGQNYIFNRLSIGEGLLSNHVLCVWQDDTGYLWIGTQSGLQRFDGINMRTVLQRRVDQVLEDGEGRVWIRSGSRLAILNLGNFSVKDVLYEGHQEVYGPHKVWLRRDDRGRVFLVHVGRNFQYYLASAGSFSKHHNPFSVPAAVQVTDVVPDPGMKRYWVLAKNDFGYWDQRTKTYHSQSEHGLRDPLLKNNSAPRVITRLYLDNKNRYWMTAKESSEVRFLCFDRTKGRFATDTVGMNYPDPDDLVEVYGFGSYEDSITIAYGQNYFRGHHGKSFIDLKSPASNPYGIHFNAIAGIFEDREGILWVATDNGLYYTTGNRNQYTHIMLSQEKQQASISSLLADRRNRLWIGTWGRGTFLLDNEMNGARVTPMAALNDLSDAMKRVLSQCEDRQGNIWVGSDHGKLAHYEISNNRATRYTPAQFARSGVRQILEDPHGNLWFGLENGEVWMHDTNSPFGERSLQRAAALGGPVNRMVLLSGARLCVAVSGQGLFVIDIRTRKTLRSVTIARTGSSDIAAIRDILPVNDSLVLLAGEHLGVMHPNTYEVHFDYVDARRLPGTLFALQQDRAKNVWIGGATGIYKLNPVTRILTKYTQQDGLLTIHNNSYVPERSAILPNGRVAMGGNQHLVIFDPNEYITTPCPPEVTITGFQLDNQYLSLDSLFKQGIITLPYTHNSFRIDFAAISFLHRERISYEYKLDGLDDDWIPLVSGGHVSYNFLPHGRYRFSVRAKNDVGVSAPTVTHIDLKINPPFWKTIWFYLLIAVILGGVLVYLHRLHLQKLLHIEKVRNRLARDLHDDMGSTLSTINILSSIALQQKALDEAKSKQYLNTISQSTRQMMDSMDDIVWSINPVNDSVSKIVARMKETAGNVLEPQQIDYRFDIEPSVAELPLSMESRREIFLIFKEALNNISKYAACNLVSVKLCRKGHNLLLTIDDDGIGFTPQPHGSAVRGNGLKNMQMRASNLRGWLAVKSVQGQGTVIRLSVPIA